ncbi:putative Transcriptional regulator, GntR family [Desulfosarcina cetonica]|uniref:GntR family transcriptional regulator n=1 Tax=Desulfosarcina cetonica TaxID=90730 RepID=UPI0006CF5D38|nr:GntR family transcriptional regulator [Desulfosarcina cetonica]VTR71080.1 putative Transcriptional regulator, GntR family [Desulfosarcina cetonica]
MKTPRNLALASYNAIKEMMMSNAIVPGQRLILVDLAEKLGVSRTPVNNALSILAKEGYLKFIPNQGYSVRRLTREDAEDLYEVREALELSNIGKALQKMTDLDGIKLEEAKIAYADGVAIQAYSKLFLLDAEFHAVIIAMAGNQFLAQQYNELCQMIALCFRPEELESKRLPESVREHNELFQAICRRDVESAKILIRRHNVNDRFRAKNMIPAKPPRTPKAPEWMFAARMA